MFLIGCFISGLSYAQSAAVIQVHMDVGFMGKSGSHGSVRTRCSRTKKRIGRELTVRFVYTVAVLCG